MLEYVFDKTICFLENIPKSVRKKKGQFFTSVETATYMAEMFDLNGLPASVDILDPGCGTGIALNPVPCFTFSNADKAHISPFWVSILVMINPTSTDMHMLTSGTDEYVKKKFIEITNYSKMMALILIGSLLLI